MISTHRNLNLNSQELTQKIKEESVDLIVTSPHIQ
jgi:DNA modification methylase